MLKLINVNKDYYVGNTTIKALNDINLSFRKNEFVSILGPSGSGKTTLLNLIGGLDKYTSGDLIINKRSTKTFKEKDWDIYRNHRIGFIFQSYNLISHQSVLSNVELSLTIAGLSKEERTRRAKEALDRVGLSDQYNKKPNQLSGGQSQRVAIARALINDPEILLADEPTGALDSKTSKQIMDLIKEIANDRLVIMVTHNSKLAKKYSNRIIDLLDGKLKKDTNPFVDDNEEIVTTSQTKEKSKMSIWTSLRLSMQNLFTKKSRTVLTSIAGAIGIIGISLVLSLSYGVKSFISNTQNDMLSGNPITIGTSTIDLEKMMSQMTLNEKNEVIKESGYVNVQMMIEELAKRAKSNSNMFVENNISQEYIDFLLEMPKEDYEAIFFNYKINIRNNLYLDYYDSNDSDVQRISLTTLINIYTDILKGKEDTKAFASLIDNYTDILKQSPDNEDYIKDQYNILSGKIATEKNEIMLVLNKDRSISDLLLAQLGLYNQEEFINIVLKQIDSSQYDSSILAKSKFSYEDLINQTFTWYPNDSIFNKLENEMKPFSYNAYEDDIIDKDRGLVLKIVGIIEPKENISYGSLSSGVYYTQAFTNYIIEQNSSSEIINYLIEKEDNKFQSGFNTFQQGGIQIKTDFGITYQYSYNYLGELKENITGYIGKVNSMSSLISSMMPNSGSSSLPDVYVLTIRDLGGEKIPSEISIYSKDLEHKEKIINYLSLWNKMENRSEGDKITITDPLSIIFSMINSIVSVITIALVGFTALSLIVSSVMISIITYVSVVERTKEIGVIRALGGRKKDISNLFMAETFIIGLISGVIAILFTYLATYIINFFVIRAINTKIAIFPWQYALIMISISILLTLISGVSPSRKAAKKDPVVALRTE